MQAAVSGPVQTGSPRVWVWSAFRPAFGHQPSMVCINEGKEPIRTRGIWRADMDGSALLPGHSPIRSPKDNETVVKHLALPSMISVQIKLEMPVRVSRQRRWRNIPPGLPTISGAEPTPGPACGRARHPDQVQPVLLLERYRPSADGGGLGIRMFGWDGRMELGQ